MCTGDAFLFAGPAAGILPGVLRLPVFEVNGIQAMSVRPSFAVAVKEDDLRLKRRKKQRWQDRCQQARAEKATQQVTSVGPGTQPHGGNLRISSTQSVSTRAGRFNPVAFFAEVIIGRGRDDGLGRARMGQDVGRRYPEWRGLQPGGPRVLANRLQPDLPPQ